jgi:hypothetical protein
MKKFKLLWENGFKNSLKSSTVTAGSTVSKEEIAEK